MIIGVIMAGGKGTRIQNENKPLVNYKNKPMIDYVIKALNNSQYIDKIIITISNNTKKLYEHIQETPKITTLTTPAKGYVEDLSFILSHLEKNSTQDTVLFISADMPLVTTKSIDYVIEQYQKTDKEALAVYVPKSFIDQYGLKTGIVYNDMVPTGLNILTSKNTVQDEEILLIEDEGLAININYMEDLKIIEKKKQ